MLSVNLKSGSDDHTVDQQLQDFMIHGGDQIHLFPIAAYNRMMRFTCKGMFCARDVTPTRRE